MDQCKRTRQKIPTCCERLKFRWISSEKTWFNRHRYQKHWKLFEILHSIENRRIDQLDGNFEFKLDILEVKSNGKGYYGSAFLNIFSVLRTSRALWFYFEFLLGMLFEFESLFLEIRGLYLTTERSRVLLREHDSFSIKSLAGNGEVIYTNLSWKTKSELAIYSVYISTKVKKLRSVENPSCFLRSKTPKDVNLFSINELLHFEFSSIILMYLLYQYQLNFKTKLMLFYLEENFALRNTENQSKVPEIECVLCARAGDAGKKPFQN